MSYNRTLYFTAVSDANLSYRIEFYDTNATSAYQNQLVTASTKPVTIKYGSDGSKMFAPFKPSTCTFTILIDRPRLAQYFDEIRRTYQERDIYVAVFRENVTGASNPSTKPLWAGYLLMDLSDDPDEALPYPITLKAIDGLASLKHYDFIPTTTTQTADNLYNQVDTFIPHPGNSETVWRHFVELASICLLKSGPFTTSEGNTSNPQFKTAIRWFNGEFASTSVNPWRNTRVKSHLFYKVETIGQNSAGDDVNKYKAMNCYQVLKHMCEAWGVRLVYWQNDYYFIQVNQYRISQSGTFASPDDVTNWIYDLEGNLQSTEDSIQSNWNMYELYLDNSQNSESVKWNKLAGGKYGVLPAFKKVTVDFLNASNTNLFTQFPRIPDNPSTSTSAFQHLYNFEHLGVFTCDGVTDQAFFQRINLQIHNPSQYSGHFHVHWCLVARPAGTGTNTANTSPNSNGWTYYLQPSAGSSTGVSWQNMTILAFMGFPFESSYWITPGTQTKEITANSPLGVAEFPILTASEFTAGDWELAYYVKSSCATSAASTGSMANGNWQRHGAFYPAGLSGSSSNPHDYNISYTDVAISQGLGSSEFAPIVNGAVGTYMTQTNMIQTGDDTAHETISNVLFGDCGNNTSEGTIQIYTGSVWQPSDFGGAWGIDTLSGGNSLAQQLADDIFQAQAKTTNKFNVAAVLDPGNNVYYSDGTSYIPQYASPLTRWITPSHLASFTPLKTWIMHTGEFDIINDTWKFTLYQQKFWNITTTVSTNSTNGWNSGNNGGMGTGEPTNDIIGIAQPTTGVSNMVARLSDTSLEPVAYIRENTYISLSGETASQTITSLNIGKLENAIFKSGDTIVLQTKSFSKEIIDVNEYVAQPKNRIKFVVNADQAAGATTLSVTSKTIYQDINVGDTISFDTEDLFKQYNHKTKGTIGGFTIDADGLTKDGVEITGWIDSSTMDGTSSSLVPTSSSVKTYVDTQVSSIPKGLVYQGTWNANTNSPPIESSSGTVGHYYIVGTEGTTTIDGISDWKVGDWIIFSSTDVWQKIDQTESDTLQTVTTRGNVTTTNIELNDGSGDSPKLKFVSEDGGSETNGAILMKSNGKMSFEVAGASRFKIESDGDVTVGKNITTGGTVDGRNISTDGSQLDTNTASISTNAASITSNAADISTNSSNISTNTGNISTNSSNISTNTSNIDLKAPLASPTFTGTIQLPSITDLASAVNANTNKTGIDATQAQKLAYITITDNRNIDTMSSDISTNTSNIDLKAPIDDPTFTTKISTPDIVTPSITNATDITIDTDGDLILDAKDNDIIFKDDGTSIASFTNSSQNLQIKSLNNQKTIEFRVKDSEGTDISALNILETGLIVDGNISLTGTVDGRNIANDGSQIDTNEADILTNDGNISTNTANISTNSSNIALKAPLADPTFTGTVTTDPNGLDIGTATVSAVSGQVKIISNKKIILDSANGEGETLNIQFKEAGTNILQLSRTSSQVILKTIQDDDEFLIKGEDGETTITALKLDMAANGDATFSGNIILSGSNTVDGVDISALNTTVDGKQNTITLTTEGSSGAATFNSGTGALNIPQYSGGLSSIKSFQVGVSETQAISSGGNVGSKTSYTIINFDTAIGGVAAVSPFAIRSGGGIKIEENGNYMINFSIATTVSGTANRTLAGAMLYKEDSAGEIDSLTGTQIFNYDRGTETSSGAASWGSVYDGAGSGSYLLKVDEIGTSGITYMEIFVGFWIEGRASSSSGITSNKDGCVLNIMQLRSDA